MRLTKQLPMVERYDFETKVWEAAAPMAEARNYHAVAVLEGKLYAVGGNIDVAINVGVSLSSVERYDPATNAWEAVAPMATARLNHATAVLDGKLYAVGGYNGDYHLSSVERYDPALDAWEAVTPMAETRQSGVVVLDGKLYVVGGYDGGHLRSVERYDPGTDAWEAVAPLTLARFGAGMAALEGKLYAVGGRIDDEEDDEAEVDSNSVERFDPASNAWEEVAPMATARAFSFALLM